MVVAEFRLENYIFKEISIGSGFIQLDTDCNKLYLELNDLIVNEHNIAGVPIPLKLEFSTNNYMDRI